MNLDKTKREDKVLTNIRDLILQSMELLDEIKKSQKSDVLIYRIIITFSVLVIIGILSVIIFYVY